MPDTIFVLNGPNLNLLGLREPEVYGHDTLDDIAGQLEDRARALDCTIDMRQSNHEGHLVDWLHEAQARGAKAVIINPGAYTHSSIALHDAIKAITTPVIEVHLDRKSTRLNSVTNAHLVCRLLLEKKTTIINSPTLSIPTHF